MPLRDMFGVGCRLLGLVCLLMALAAAGEVPFYALAWDSRSQPLRIHALQFASAIVSLALLAVVGLHLLQGGRMVHRLEFGDEEEFPSRKAEDLFAVLMKLCGIWMIGSGLVVLMSDLQFLIQTIWQRMGAAVFVVAWTGATVALGFYLLMGGQWVRRIAFARDGQNTGDTAAPGR